MSKIIIFAVVVGAAALFFAPSFRSTPSPVVTIKDGKLHGRVGYSRDGKEYFEYLSIPFAEPPVGNLRFEAPVPLKQPWSGIKKAITYPPFCLQMDAILRGKVYGQEDCLYLNVFTHSTGGRPVMVYIHGGGYLNGASKLYEPDFFMDEDVVLVTVNYRLGPLGFFQDQDGLIRGNMGLKDQNMALKWVQQNIESFGGDPGKVTLFGESAGASSVEYHMVSSLSKGLFHRAILQSGAVTCPWAFRENLKDTATEFIKNTECANEKGDKLVKCLKQIDAVDLVKQSISTMDPTNPLHIFVPTVETIVKDDTFLAENPRKMLKSGKLVNNVPIMFGLTSGEGAFRTARIDAMSDLIPYIDKNWEELAARLLLYFDDADISAETAKKLRNKYFGTKGFTENLHEFKKNFTIMASDGIFFEPVLRAAKLHAKHGAPTFMFFYDYDLSTLPSVYSLLRAVRSDDWLLADLKLAYASFVDLMKKKWIKSEGPHEFGTTHGDDLLMLWNMEGWTGNFAGPDAPFSKAFVKVMVDFAKHKEPLEFNGVPWPTINEENPRKYMLISNQAKVVPEPFTEGANFWESLKIRE